jgi:hypothetical protein
MALIPQRIWYDQLLLFLVPSSAWPLSILVSLSWVAAAVSPGVNLIAQQDPRAWLAVVCLLYLPTLGILFWEKRNYLIGRIHRH